VFGSADESPEATHDLDFACAEVAAWTLFELGARMEKALRVPLGLVPLEPLGKLTRIIGRQGTVLL
jgi:hypothetical protein